MTDDDLIRRGDALEICTDYGFSRADECRDAIAALPAVTVPDSNVQKMHIATPAALEPVVAPAQCCMCGKRDLSTEEDGGPECQMNDGRWVCSRECYGTACALLEPVAAPDPVALLRDVPRYEPDNPLDNAPSMKADPQGDWLREADVLAALSRAIIQKGAADDRA